MTTPRDAIGLSERLRNAAEDSKRFGAAAWVFEPMLEAATALDALQARVKELEADRDRWKRHAQDETETAVAVHFELRTKLSRAEQERDEALERLEPFASVASWLGSAVPDSEVMYRGPGSSITEGHLRAARDLVRRLAAGTEKEGK